MGEGVWGWGWVILLFLFLCFVFVVCCCSYLWVGGVFVFGGFCCCFARGRNELATSADETGCSYSLSNNNHYRDYQCKYHRAEIESSIKCRACRCCDF